MKKDINAYHRPDTIRDAIDLLEEDPSGRVVLAGGTHLVPEEIEQYEEVVDIQDLDLSDLAHSNRTVEIGALVTVAQLQKSELLSDSNLDVVQQAALDKPSQLIRNQATVGGEIGRGGSGSELAAVFLALEANVVLTNENGSRECSLKNVYGDNGETKLGSSEIITRIELSVPAEEDQLFYDRLSRTENDVSLGHLAFWGRPENGGYEDVRLVVGGVTDAPRRMKKVEALVKETVEFDRETLDAIRDRLAEELSPPDDFRASAEYRLDVLQTFLERALVSTDDIPFESNGYG
ncbi:MAG: xanthine dehydrogenase family protein subunit M [bacterium]